MAGLARHVFFPLDQARTGEFATVQYLQRFERSQWSSPEEIRAAQLARLKTQLEHAHRTMPYYREAFDEVGVHPGSVRSLEDLRIFPILEKRHIQENRDRMVCQTWPADDLIPDATGGSTGEPVQFFYSLDRKCARAAATLRHNRWAGWDIGDKSAVVWGAPRDLPGAGTWKQALRHHLLDRRIVLDTGRLTEEDMRRFDETLKSYRPKIILAYARSLSLFARYLETRNIDGYRPQAIVTSAEVLEEEDRKLIERVFGAPVFNRYGCREVSVLASECETHQGLHTMAEGLYIEVVRGDAPAAPGEDGEILVTDLLNRAMPLIRYRIGDVGSWSEGDCACGRGLPRLTRIQGRVTDFLVGTEGQMVSGVFLATYVVAQRPSLGQVQILQTRKGEICYRLRTGAAFDPGADIAYLIEATRRHLGSSIKVEWEEVDALERTPTGKFIFSRSTVSPDFL